MNTKRPYRWLMVGMLVLAFSAISFAQIGVGIAVSFGPPAIPIYTQPICPGPGYIWTPGYWAWDDDGGYYWVPGTWVVAPIGMLWTPGYWGWDDGFYRWHGGYWGPHVGFYGGINYGFGYTGVGFWGGEWRGGSFFYNRSVTNINVTRVTNVYQRNVVVNQRSRVSYNGGSGGINARPTREEERFSREPRREALADQRQHERAASQNRQLFASQNHGRPAVAATGRPGEFNGRNVVAARQAGAPYRAPRISPQQARVSSPQNRGAEQRNLGSNRSASRPVERQQSNRNLASNNSRQQAQQQKRDQGRQQQARAEQQKQQQQARQQQQAERQQQARVQQQQQQQNRQQQMRTEQQQRQQQARAQQQRQQQNRQQQARAEQQRQPQARAQQQRQQQAARQQPAPRVERPQPQQSHNGSQPQPSRGGREGRGPGR